MIRFILRVVAVVAIGVAVYLVLFQPKATVAQSSLLTKISVQVKCSSVWSQWTHHAQPASLLLNGQPLTSVPEAQNSCNSASHTIRHIAYGLAGGGVVLVGLSALRRRTRL